ncbi:MAG: urate hydroxylase PuuD, partial [Xanthobacteraceae bacterium]
MLATPAQCKEASTLDPVLSEWLSAILRWLHVVAAIAWIGSSFYFIHLDLSLKARPCLPAGVKGDEWQVHGGGFYHMMKYLVAPAQMPDSLTWFKWEAYTTFLSGFALLVVIYYLGANLFLIDDSVLALTPVQAAGIAFVSLVVAWLVYEGLCRSPLGQHEVALALVGYVFLVALTYGFTHVFSGRGAFTQIGALIGTIMVANVFVIIIPYQKKTVAALLAGKEPDPRWGQLGKQRSVHNNYLTLPVVFLMLSNHYPLFFATRYNWLIVAIVLAIGPVIRHFFNSRHEGKGSPWWTWAVAA